MKFNGYIVQLEHKDSGFTGIMTLKESNEAGTDTEMVNVSANFKKIARDLFIANFKKQVQFHFKEKVNLKNRNKDFTVLLPVTSKFNKRKLTRISKFLVPMTGNEKNLLQSLDRTDILMSLIAIEKFVKADDLLEFFDFPREEFIEFLLDKEVEQELKIIYVSNLTIISKRNIDDYMTDMSTFLTNCHTTRIKNVKISDIASSVKLPPTSMFFRYLVRRLASNYSYKVFPDKIVFQQMPLSEFEKKSLSEIEQVLHECKKTVFSIENLIKFTGHEYDLVNESLWMMVESGQVVRLNEKYFIFKDDLGKLVYKLKTYKRNQGELIDIPALRDLTLLSRRHLIALFEYFDEQKITERVDNRRKILISV